jgi:hypothetical protein
MQYEVQKHPDLPVVIGRWHEGFKFDSDGASYEKMANAVLDKEMEPVFYILDMSELRTISMDGLVQASNSVKRTQNSSYGHPMNREMIFVSEAKIIKLAVKGVTAASFGNLKIRPFDTLDEALAYVEESK